MVTIGTFLMIAVVLYIFIQKRYLNEIYKSVLVLTIIVELMIGRGYFIELGSQQIAYRTLCEVLLFGISLVKIILNFSRINRKVLRCYVALVLAIMIGWFTLVLFPSGATGATMETSWDKILTTAVGRQKIVYNSSMIIEMIQILMYVIIAIVAFSYVSNDEWENIIDRVIKWSRWILYICMFEIFTKYILKSNIFLNIVDKILGTSIATETTLRIREYGYTLCGFTKEGAAQAITVTFLFIIFFIRFIEKKETMIKKEKRKYYLSFLCMVATFLLSMSFSILYYTACLGLIVWCVLFERRGNSVLKLILTMSIVIGGIVIVMNLLPAIAQSIGSNTFWGRRINSLVEEIGVISNGTWLKASTALEWSNRVRLGSTYETFKLLRYRPLFGLGLAAVTAHSSLAMLVAGSGLIGSYLYIKAMFFSTGNVKNKEIYLSLILVFLLITLFTSISLRPYYEAWGIMIAIIFQRFSDVLGIEVRGKHHK